MKKKGISTKEAIDMMDNYYSHEINNAWETTTEEAVNNLDF